MKMSIYVWIDEDGFRASWTKPNNRQCLEIECDAVSPTMWVDGKALDIEE